MNEFEMFAFLNNAYYEFRQLLSKMGHPDPDTRAFTMTAELLKEVHHYQALWRSVHEHK